MKILVIEAADHELAKLAESNGCNPVWSDYYKAYCCHCEDGAHIGDQQCSIISRESAGRGRPPR